MEYKDIKGFKGDYQADIEGNVYSLKYGKRRLLKPDKTKNGYLQVGLHKDGKVKMFLVHRLVAEAFLPNPDNLPQVNHKNEDKTDNRVENLEFCDRKYNVNYGTGIKRSAKARTGAKRSEEFKRRMSEWQIGKKLSEETKIKMSEAHKGVFINRSDQSKPVNQYTLDGLLVGSYPSAAEASRQTGYNRGHISACCRGEKYYKSSYGYIWKYV